MFTLPERFIFAIFALASMMLMGLAFLRIIRIICAGQGKPDWHLAVKRLPEVFARMLTFQPVFRFRFWASLFHALVGWGFGFYVLINLFDVIKAYLPGFEIPGRIGDIYRLLADLLTGGVLIGMIYFVLRRFVFRSPTLSTRATTQLHPKARTGIYRCLLYTSPSPRDCS